MKTIDEVFAEFEARLAEQRKRGSKLHDHIEEIATLINLGVDLAGIISYVEGNGIKSKNGKPLAESFIQNFCVINIFKWDQKNGTTDEVKSRRHKTFSKGADQATRERLLKWELEANGIKVPNRSQNSVVAPQVESKSDGGTKQAFETKEASGAVKVTPKTDETFKGLNAKKGVVVSTTPEDTSKALAEAVAKEFAVKESERTMKSPLGRIQMEQEAKLNRNNE